MNADAALQKPKALHKGSRIAVVAPSSPAQEPEIAAGCAELIRMGYSVELSGQQMSDGYFAATVKARLARFLEAVATKQVDGLFAVRGGYGSNYLLTADLSTKLSEAKCLVGFSDLTSLQTYLLQSCGWVTFYGPMVAAGFNRGPNAPAGYDSESFAQAVTNSESGWKIPLQGESLVKGSAEGRVVG